MLRKTAFTIAAGSTLLLAQGAQAAEEVGLAYLKGMGTYIAADDDRAIDDEVVGGLAGFGYALHQNLNVELDIGFLNLDGDSSPSLSAADQDQTAINLNLMPMLNRDGFISPYALLGVGVVNTDVDGLGDEDDLQLQAGVGALWKLFGRRLSLRTEVLQRYQDGGFRQTGPSSQGFTGSSLNDWLVNVGFQVALGSKAAPVVAAAPVAAAVAAAPPPPPPPPPPADTDGDGVVDTADQCPDTPKGDRVGPQGCSCDITRQLQFALNSAELTAGDKVILDEVIENLKRLKFVSGTVVGHTDSSGSDAYNQKLSERRANTVARYLEERGIAAGRLAISGAGESEPIADNKTAEGRAQNRRVVLKRTDCDAPK
jgi:OOP family OmpA-OmpF porin